MSSVMGSCVCAVAVLAAAPAQAQDDAPVKRLHNQDLRPGQALVQQARFEEAAAELREAVRTNPDDAGSWFLLGYSLHALGELDQALPIHLMATEFPQTAPVASYNIACVYALKNKSDKAFEWMQKAVNAGVTNVQQYRDDTDLDSIKEDPRFERILATITPASSPTPPITTTATTSGGSTDAAALPPERHFDFWVGDWNVVNDKGQKVGSNRIQSVEAGHVIMEQWTGAGGSSGRSMNYYDPGAKLWKQVWVDATGGVIYYEGSFRDGAMRFTGSYVPVGKPREIARSSFTPRPDGTVHQFIEHSRDDGKTWYVYFDGIYVRK